MSRRWRGIGYIAECRANEVLDLCTRVYEEILDAMNSFGYRNGGREKTSFLQKMPRGCDRRYTNTGRAYYVDHVQKRTQWEPLVQEEPRAAGLAHSEIIALNALKINDGDKTKAKSFVIDHINTFKA